MSPRVTEALSELCTRLGRADLVPCLSPPSDNPSNAAPSNAAPSMSLFRIKTGDSQVQEFKEEASSDAKAVVGAVVQGLLSGDPVHITAVGLLASTQYQMVKALAMSRLHLEERSQASITACTQMIVDANEPEHSEVHVSLSLTPCPSEHIYEQSDILEYKVCSTTPPKSTAKAIISCIRAGYSCRLQALAPEAVAQAIKGFAIGRAIANRDNIDIFFVPGCNTKLDVVQEHTTLELLVLPVKGA